MMRRVHIVGPDPRALDDAELLEAAGHLVALGKRIGGVPPSTNAVHHLAPALAFVVGFVNVGVELLRAELLRRLDGGMVDLGGEADRYLRDLEAGG